LGQLVAQRRLGLGFSTLGRLGKWMAQFLAQLVGDRCEGRV